MARTCRAVRVVVCPDRRGPTRTLRVTGSAYLTRLRGLVSQFEDEDLTWYANGGEVYVVDDGAVPGDSDIAALYRF